MIVDARTDGYCDSEDFTIELADCLACALEYDIWQYYGTSVSEAAEACGLTATPAEASSTTTSDSASATETAEQSATSVVDSSIITDTASSATRTTIISTSVPSSNGVRISSRPFSSIPSATAARSSVSFASTYRASSLHRQLTYYRPLALLLPAPCTVVLHLPHMVDHFLVFWQDFLLQTSCSRIRYVYGCM